MKSWTILLSTLCLFSCNQQENKFEKYVDPLIGTDIRIVQGKDKNSTEERGQIMPAVGVPRLPRSTPCYYSTKELLPKGNPWYII